MHAACASALLAGLAKAAAITPLSLHPFVLGTTFAMYASVSLQSWCLDRCQVLRGLVPSTDVTAVDDDPVPPPQPATNPAPIASTQERQSSLFSIGPPYRKSHIKSVDIVSMRETSVAISVSWSTLSSWAWDSNTTNAETIVAVRVAVAALAMGRALEGSAFSAGCLLGAK